MKTPLLVGSLTTLALVGVPAWAQSSVSSPSVPKPQSEVVTLTPFEVNTSQDRGYAAQNTIAGTRLNTPIADLGTTLSVITPEMIEDLAATDANQLSFFTPGAERETTQTQENQQTNIFFADQIRVRGIALDAFSWSRNYFKSEFPMDTYNASSFTFTRGPNAILFGLGSAAASVERSTQEAAQRNSASVQFRTDNYGSARGVTNFNWVVIPGTLAVRLVSLLEDTKTWREPIDFKRQKRLYVAAKWTPTRKLMLKANAERMTWQRTAPMATIHFDGVTPWLGAGQPGRMSNSGATAINPTGIQSWNTANSTAVVHDGNDATPLVQNWRHYAVGLRNTVAGNAATSLPPGFLAEEFSLIGRQRFQDFWANAINVSASYAVLDSLQVEYAYNYEFVHYDFRNTNLSSTLSVDASTTLPDGITRNPNFGRYFVGDIDASDIQNRRRGNNRVVFSYDLDFGAKPALRYLGRHTLTGMLEEATTDIQVDRTRLFNTTPLPGFTTANANAQNRIHTIHYVDIANRSIIGDTDLRKLQGSIAPGVNTAFLPDRVGTGFKERVRSAMVVWQGRFWADRVVTTFGWRKDYMDRWDKDFSKTVPLGPGLQNYTRTVPWLRNELVSNLAPATGTSGVVFHALRDLGAINRASLFYNTSDAFVVSGFNNAPDGKNLPDQTGRTRDYGLRFDLLKNRVSGVFTLFNADIKNQPLGTLPGPGIAVAISDLYELIGETGKVGIRVGDTQNTLSKGWEFQLTANLLPNWRLAVSAGHFKTSLADIDPATRRVVAEWKDRWLANPQAPVPNRVNESAQTVYDNMLLALNTVRAQEGGITDNERGDKYTLVTNYEFSDGPLKHWGIGCNAVWRSAPAIGYPLKVLAGSDPLRPTYVADSARPFFGRSDFATGANLSYRRKIFRRGIEWKMQLNVTNLSNDTTSEIIRMSVRTDTPETPIPRVRSLVEPRAFVLTNTFRF